MNHEGHAAFRRAGYAREDVNGRLVFTLLDISHTMRGLYEGRGSQKRVLMVLSETGTITQRELTGRLGIQPGSVSEVLTKLENAGLVARTPSESDHRTADISLTEKGREQAAEARAQRVQRHAEMFSILTGEEKDQLLALLEKVHGDWEERYAPGPGRRHDHSPHTRWEDGGRQGCSHDCASCPHPCGKGRALREGSL